MAETQERVILGKSILVPSVKELAQKSLVTVPERYIRCDHNNNNSNDNNNEGVDNCSSDFQLPIIDMQALICEDEIELQRLHSACKESGFFQCPLWLEVLASPLETDIEGFGQAFVVSEEQKLDWADMFYLTTHPKYQRRSHLLPMLPLPFREILESYSIELQSLAINIIECMGKALNIEAQVMRDVFGDGNQSIRMTYYPPCPQPDKVIGLTPHSDPVALTILLHINEVEGLQIRKDDKWSSIKPLPNAFIINVGDVLEIVSNGIYRSILHQAVVNAFKERLSVATFYSAANDREIGPIPSLITTKNPAKFRRISMLDYWKGLYSKVLDGKSYLDMMNVS